MIADDMTERTVEMAIVDVREAAENRDWLAFGRALSEFPDAQGMKNVALRILRKALLDSSEEQASAIIAWLTPETLVSLQPDIGGACSLAEALMRAPDIDAISDLVRQSCDLAAADLVMVITYVRILGRQNKRSAIRQFIELHPEAFARPEAKLIASEYVGLKSDERKAVIDYIETLPADAPPQFRMMGIRWLFTIGEEERAQRIARQFSESDAPKGFDAAVDVMRCAPDRPSRLEPSERHPEILVGHSEGDRGAVIYFGGIGPGGMNGGHLLDRYLAEISLTMIAVSDESNLLCLAGIPGVADTIDASVDALGALVAELGLETIYTTGGSAGGFSAMVYGLQLRAARALLFGSPTHVSPGNDTVETRAIVVRRRLMARFEPHKLDIIHWLDTSDHELPITLYYAADNQIDAWQAGRIADRPDVRLIAMTNTASHQAMIEAARDRSLGEVFAEAFGLAPSGAP